MYLKSSIQTSNSIDSKNYPHLTEYQAIQRSKIYTNKKLKRHTSK